jgi:beta-N-acetylhexosaminidase
MTLVVTFVLGLGAGFTLFYALADTLGWNFGPQVIATAPPAPEAPVAPGVTPPEEAAPLATPAPAPKANLEPLGASAHLFVAMKGNTLEPAMRELLAQIKPGGVLLEPEGILDEAQAQTLVGSIKEAVGLGAGIEVPPLVGIAQEGGTAFNPLGVADLPGPEDLGGTNDPVAAKEAGLRSARAARSRGIGLVWAPVLDVFRPGISDVAMKPRMFGESADVVKTLGLAFAEGVREGGAASMVKHYPGLGAAARGGDGTLAIRLASEGSVPAQQFEIRQLAALMFPFSEAAAEKIPAMLVAHVAVPALDPEYPDLPASASPKLVQRLLREQWKYDGLVLADDLAASPLMKDQSLAQVAVAAIKAGCDAVLIRGAGMADLEAIRDALQVEIPAERLTQSRMRIELVLNQLAEASEPGETAPPPPTPVPAPEIAAPPVEAAPAQETPPVEPATANAAPAQETPPPTEPVATEAVTVDEPSAAEAAGTEAAPETPAKPPAPEAVPETPTEPSATEAGPETSPEPKPPAPKPAAKKREPASQPPGTRLVRHEVQRGDTLMSISRKYSVSASNLLSWNALADANLIKSGQTIKVYLPESNAETPSASTEAAPEVIPENTPAAETTKPTLPVPAPAPGPSDTETSRAEPPDEAPSAPGDFTYYVVRRGDSLEKIARKHGVDKAVLLEMNDLSNPNSLPSGTRLKVPKKSE